MSDGVKLRAISKEDLTIFSSLLQDAVARVGDLAWQADQHRFAAVFNRFRWEKKRGIWPFRRRPERISSALHFNGIIAVESDGFDSRDKEAFLNLLAITYEEGQNNNTYLRFDFSAGATIRLHCECIDGVLSDISDSWQAIREPQHK